MTCEKYLYEVLPDVKKVALSSGQDVALLQDDRKAVHSFCFLLQTASGDLNSQSGQWH